MKIRLVNFRCYTDQTFDLGENCLSLISGPSGMGKSSIFIGIYFALYGVGKKIATHGKRSCLVELTMNDMVITRTRVPNRLILQTDSGVYEDDCAQEIINKKFSNTFDVTGYIAQNAVNSFIMMSPNDKRKFLEKFAFKDINLMQIKENNKRYTSQTYTELTSITAQLQLAQQVLEELPVPESIPFPVKCKVSQRDLVIKNTGVRVKNANTLIKRYLGRKSELEQELSDLRVMSAEIRTRQETIANMTQQISDTESQLSKSIYNSRLLTEYERKLENFTSTRKISELVSRINNDKAKLEEMRQEEVKQISNRINEINNIIYQKYSQEEITSLKHELSAYLADIESVESLTRELAKISIDSDKLEKNKRELSTLVSTMEEKKKLLDKIEQAKKIRVCPSCSTCLRIENDILVICDTPPDVTYDKETLTREIKDIGSQINILSKSIPIDEAKVDRASRLKTNIENISNNYNEELDTSFSIKKQLADLSVYESEQIILEKERSSLENNKLSISYQKCEKNLRLLEDQLIMLRKNTKTIEVTETEEELRNNIQEQKSSQAMYNQLTEQKTTVMEYLAKKQQQLQELKSKYKSKYPKELSQKDIMMELTDLAAKIAEQEKIKVDSEEQMRNIETWQKNSKEIENYKIWENKVSMFTKNEKICRKKYASSTRLKETILKAESLALHKITETINMHASVFLEAFFPDEPILVQLVPEKETKKGTTKPQVDLIIEFKGNECDLSSLSGGELARVILGFSLALAEMHNMPLILLDECTSSLDGELTEVVFEGIRENLPGKTIFAIAHQVISGLFDNNIQLNNKPKKQTVKALPKKSATKASAKKSAAKATAKKSAAKVLEKKK